MVDDWGRRVAPKEYATTSALRDVELKLARRINELTAQVDSLTAKLSALTLGTTCHPEWVRPMMGPAACARRGNIIEAILQMAGNPGMSVPLLAAYLHVPRDRHDVIAGDLLYLSEQERIKRIKPGSATWRIREARTNGR